jgi:hypothetical protein
MSRISPGKIQGCTKLWQDCKIWDFHCGDYEECLVLGCAPCSSCVNCSHLLTLLPRSWICLPWRWRRYVPPKRPFIQELRGTASQKTTFCKRGLIHLCYIPITTLSNCSKCVLSDNMGMWSGVGDDLKRGCIGRFKTRRFCRHSPGETEI